MSIVVKAFLEKAGDPKGEIRRFSVPSDATSSYTYINEKVSEVFQCLARRNFSVYWKDQEGDLVSFSSDAELLEALDFVNDGVFKIYVKENNSDPQEIHPGVYCDGCNGAIYGVRYKCFQCADYDLCSDCKGKGLHPDHEMSKITTPRASGHGPMVFMPPPHLRQWMKRYMKRHCQNGCPWMNGGRQNKKSDADPSEEKPEQETTEEDKEEETTFEFGRCGFGRGFHGCGGGFGRGGWRCGGGFQGRGAGCPWRRCFQENEDSDQTEEPGKDDETQKEGGFGRCGFPRCGRGFHGCGGGFGRRGWRCGGGFQGRGAGCPWRRCFQENESDENEPTMESDERQEPGKDDEIEGGFGRCGFPRCGGGFGRGGFGCRFGRGFNGCGGGFGRGGCGFGQGLGRGGCGFGRGGCGFGQGGCGFGQGGCGFGQGRCGFGQGFGRGGCGFGRGGCGFGQGFGNGGCGFGRGGCGFGQGFGNGGCGFGQGFGNGGCGFGRGGCGFGRGGCEFGQGFGRGGCGFGRGGCGFGQGFGRGGCGQGFGRGGCGQGFGRGGCGFGQGFQGHGCPVWRFLKDILTDENEQTAESEQTQEPANDGETEKENSSTEQMNVVDPKPETDGEPITAEDEWTMLNNAFRRNAANSQPLHPQPAASVPLHPDAKINDALKQMLSMGFHNEGGWLASLLEIKNGDISQVLDSIRPQRSMSGGFVA